MSFFFFKIVIELLLNAGIKWRESCGPQHLSQLSCFNSYSILECAHNYSPFPKKKKLLIKRFIALLSVHMFKRKISIYSVCLCQICTVALGNLILKISPVFFIFFRYIMTSVCVIFCQFCEPWEQPREPAPRIRSPRSSCVCCEIWIFPNWWGSQMELFYPLTFQFKHKWDLEIFI